MIAWKNGSNEVLVPFSAITAEPEAFAAALVEHGRLTAVRFESSRRGANGAPAAFTKLFTVTPLDEPESAEDWTAYTYP